MQFFHSCHHLKILEHQESLENARFIKREELARFWNEKAHVSVEFQGSDNKKEMKKDFPLDPNWLKVYEWMRKHVGENVETHGPIGKIWQTIKLT